MEVEKELFTKREYYILTSVINSNWVRGLKIFKKLKSGKDFIKKKSEALNIK